MERHRVHQRRHEAEGYAVNEQDRWTCTYDHNPMRPARKCHDATMVEDNGRIYESTCFRAWEDGMYYYQTGRGYGGSDGHQRSACGRKWEGTTGGRYG